MPEEPLPGDSAAAPKIAPASRPSKKATDNVAGRRPSWDEFAEVVISAGNDPKARRIQAITHLFQDVHQELKPRTSIPMVHVRFRAYSNVDTRIRLSADRSLLTVSMSDVLEGAPRAIYQALAYILLGKLYSKPAPEAYQAVYREYIHRPEIREQSRRIKRERGGKQMRPPRGIVYDLDEIFDRLNARYFEGRLAKPKLGWSKTRARRALGHYDAAHEAIVVSSIFDHPKTPAYVVEYVMYHEMLHIKHPVEVRGGRRLVHSAAFRREEKSYPDYKRANAWIRRELP